MLALCTILLADAVLTGLLLGVFASMLRFAPIRKV
ncbi:uncharacterized protein involved in exopolysaccharide biosynthesis [Bradyrhizobium japonicum]|jgi:hypothetical protein|uniref:Uncharacterized protein involved in exopolysaccharide biosynthesis n=1 Tax=Bradyrhizobium elkanii TaxID=29448 RepID=A0A8I1Y8A1_BRAEL|nr:uncharacterized protein involved in exopolysaccharide biosynthesis [Bradyrhizobium elkanii]MCS4012146.1 uncharacterized protein involved in exopolysaccharide biosynthesis [Bradyrhizobium elkanii USDA 61]MCP1733298.1 uncharacterized protein involved in exopolysaccharide biosynthesis [Bradyrhizobium elkanii]MCP1933902.1 uncharacterized protein involved in exopolysaccharide biosynthesis [Bradyrhizobium elkanii]MCS3478090.1 uncharacterized protein involved in exopolysaccharide biosynthesis [Brad